MNLDMSKLSKKILINTIFLFLLVLIVLPLVMMFFNVFFVDNKFVGLANFREYFLNPALFASLKNSVFVSFVTSIAVTFFSFIFAYAVKRTNIRFRKILNVIGLLPMFIPTMTHAIAMIYLFGENGIFTTGFFGKFEWLSFNFPLYGKWGIIIAEFFYLFPIIYTMFCLSFSMCDYRMYETAELMGTSKFRIFITVALSDVKYTIVSALFSAFTMTFSDFGIPKVLGGNYNVLATDIYKQVIGQSNITMGSTVAVILLIPTVISFIIDKRINADVNSIKSSAKRYVVKKNYARDLFFGGLSYTISIAILILVISVVVAAFVKQWPYDLTLTTNWFIIKDYGISAIELFSNTIFVSVMSAVIGTIFVILTAYVTQRLSGYNRIKNIIDFISVLPLAVPGLVIGLSYLLFFNSYYNPLKFIYATYGIMVLANIIHFFSVPYMSMKNSMKKIDIEYENVSETMGIPWYCVFDDVILPIIKPEIIESFQYYFLNSMMTVSSLIFLYTSKTKVASVEMILIYDEGYLASAAAVAVLILIINLIARYGIDLYRKYYSIDKADKKMKAYKVMQIINEIDEVSQRKLSEILGISLGKINGIIRECISEEWIMKIQQGKKVKYEITEKGFEILRYNIEQIKEDKLIITKDSYKKIETAVILAAGKKNDFEVSPAGLEIGDSFVIKEIVKSLKINGINKIIVIAGYGIEKIRDILRFEDGITIVESTTYINSGSMDSLMIAKDYIKDDFLLIEGDLVFEDKAISFILNSEKRESVLTTNVSNSGDEEFVQIKCGNLFKLGKDKHQFNRIDGEYVGIVKISYKLYELILREYKDNMNLLLNFDYILLDVSRDFKVPCLHINDLMWSEIDSFNQYEIAKEVYHKIKNNNY